MAGTVTVTAAAAEEPTADEEEPAADEPAAEEPDATEEAETTEEAGTAGDAGTADELAETGAPVALLLVLALTALATGTVAARGRRTGRG